MMTRGILVFVVSATLFGSGFMGPEALAADVMPAGNQAVAAPHVVNPAPAAASDQVITNRPATRVHRYTLAEKRAAVEARKKKLAEIEAKKAAAQTPVIQTGK